MINYPMQYEMEQQIVDLIAEIEALKREKNHYIQEWSDACDENQGLLNKLAASQAREKALRKAIVGLVGAETVDELRQIEAAMRVLPVPSEDMAVSINAIHALLQLTDDTALKAALAAERERCLEIIRDLANASDPDDFALDALNQAEAAISAMGDE